MKKIALVALMAAAAMAANAQESLGTLSNVKGNISISGAGFVSKAANGTPLLEGSKVLVSNNAKATVVLANGCSVPLSSGQHLTVTSALTCAQLQASVKELFTPYRVAQAGTTGFMGTTGATAGTTAAVVGGLVVVSIVGFAAVNEDEQTSP
jgi:hypothetical protein